MSAVKHGFLFLSFALLTACAITGVKTDSFNEEAFEQAKTFVWKSAPIPKTNKQTHAQYDIDQKMRSSINKVMIDKGYTLSTSDTADLYVDYDYKLEPTIVAEQPDVSEASISYSRDTGLTKSRADEGTQTVTLKAVFSINFFDQTKKEKALTVFTRSKDLEHESQADKFGIIDRLIHRVKMVVPSK